MLSTAVWSDILVFDSGRFAKPCTCDDLRKRLTEVKKEGEIHKDLYKEGARFDSFADLNAEVGVRMGWTNVYSIGKGGAGATETEKQDATEKCLSKGTCDWICKVSINGVHEKYHDWWDVKGVSTPHVISRAIGDTTESGERLRGKMGPTQWRKTRDKIRSEIGAHDVEAQFLRDTIQRGASPRSVVGNNDYQQLTSAAVAGDVAMFLGGNWQLKDLQAGLAPADFAQWDIAPIPQADAGTRSTGTGGWVWVVFARDPARQRAAIEFIRDVEAPAHAARISEATGHLPVRRSVYRDFPVFSQDQWYRRFGEMLADGHARPTVPIYPEISQRLQLAIGSVVSGEKTPDEALDEAWRAVTDEYARQTMSRTSVVRRGVDALAWVPIVLAVVFPVAMFWRRGRSTGAVPWVLPAVALVTIILIYPMLDLLRLSLTDATVAGNRYRYTFESYRALLADGSFYGMVGVTAIFVAGSVVLQLTIGFALAWLIDAGRRRRVPGTLVARMAVVSAWVIPGVLAGVLWKILLIENRSGIVTYYLSQAGVGPLPLISSPSLALASVIVANVWRGCAFSMILLYAGLQRVPRELHEAADLEGVSAWQRLRWLLIPQLAPVIALNLVLITIASFNTFDLIIPLTGGGPARGTEVISLFMYRLGFFDLEAGRAAAVAVVMLAVNLTLAWIAGRLIAREAPRELGAAAR